MSRIQSGVCKGKIWIVPRGENSDIKSQFILGNKQQKISNLNLQWYESKTSFMERVSALLAESNLIRDLSLDLQTETERKYWQINQSNSGHGKFGVDFKPEWTLLDGHTAYLRGSDRNSQISISTIVPIFDCSLPYRFSGFFGTHRTVGKIEITPLDGQGAKIHPLNFVVPQSHLYRGGTKLKDYAYHQWSFNLPAKTVKAELKIELGDYRGDLHNVNSSFLFFTKLYFGVEGKSASAYIPYSQNAFELSSYLSEHNNDQAFGIAPLPQEASKHSEVTLAIENSQADSITLSSQEDALGALTLSHEAIESIIALDLHRAISIVRWSQSGKLKILNADNTVVDAEFGKIRSLPALYLDLLQGENLILNADFAQGLQGWQQIREARVNFSSSTRLKNGNSAYIHTQARNETNNLRIYIKDAIMPFSLIENQRYVLSGYFGYHRCVGALGLEWLDDNNRIISSISLAPDRPESRGGEHLKNYDLQKTTVVCPIGAKQVRIFVEKSTTISGKKDSFLFFTRLFFGLESSRGETLWQPAKKYFNNSSIQKTLQQEGFWSQEIAITTPNANLQHSNRISIEGSPDSWEIFNCYLNVAEQQANALMKLEGAIAAGAGKETLELYQQLKPTIDHSLKSTQVNYSQDSQLNSQKQQILDSQLWVKDWYFHKYPDTPSIQDPLEHFCIMGYTENRQPNPYFDQRFYVQNSGTDIIPNPLLHYLNTGWRNGSDPSPRFSVNAYLAENPQLLKTGQEPLGHLLANGVRGINNNPAYDLDNPNYYVIPHKTKGSKVVQDSALRGMIDFEQVELNPPNQEFNPKCLNLHWVIPDFHAGAGGHMTIFRIIRFLELFGHQQTIWINNPEPFRTSEEAFTSIVKDFLPLRAKVRYIDQFSAESEFTQAEGDIAIATDWGSVYPTLSMGNFKTRFYFVQDYEPMFYPMGSHYLAAAATYKEDLNCICASQWLQSLMKHQHQRWARSFWLAPDTTYYYPNPNPQPFNKDRLRIALYARTFTSRRAVELAILALEVLARRGVDIHVDFFGEPLDFTQAPFTCTFHGILPIKKLGELYRECDLGMVFSATNYSLVPQEMMACGLPVIDLDVESTNLTYEKGVVTLAQPSPRSIADAVVYLAENDEVRQQQIDKAADWVSKFTWHDSAKLVEQAFLERLQELDFQPRSESIVSTTGVKATVVIPTYNGGALFEQVLQRLSTQCFPWEYEVLIIDSGSQDGTLAAVKKFPQFRLHQIDKKDFGHGKTRNLGAKMAQGEYVAFLTQDALPVNDTWLYDTVVLLECYPHVAGVFGRHIAYPEASKFTKRDLYNHFAKYDDLPLVFNKQLKASDYGLDEGTLQHILHFYSDNNSCFRKSVWQEFPYPDVVYGEDQLWAKHIVNRGYSTAYAKNAVVYHSHDYDEQETFERARVEAHFFNQYFGYEMINRGACTPDFILDKLNHRDIEWGNNHDLSEAEILKKCSLNIAGIAGYMQGKKDFKSQKEIQM